MKTHIISERCAAWRPSPWVPALPRDAKRLLKHALKQSAHMPLIRRGLAQALS